jgi:SAM-dependent methyltransferase
MPLDWMDVSDLSFNSLLMLERVQLSWLPGWGMPEPEMSLALDANPAVAWLLRNKTPESSAWVDQELARAAAERAARTVTPEEVRRAELHVLARMVDLLVYAFDPAIYDRLPFLGWDSAELTGLEDFHGKNVLDIGSGTGRLAFTVTSLAHAVWAVEPVGSLRDYMRAKAQRLGCRNFYAVDGTITAIPFPDGFADVTMSGHVFGDDPEAEEAEQSRVTRQGGMIILCPGNNDRDDEVHRFLVEHGYSWKVFEEPGDGLKRKYWRRV